MSSITAPAVAIPMNPETTSTTLAYAHHSIPVSAGFAKKFYMGMFGVASKLVHETYENDTDPLALSRFTMSVFVISSFPDRVTPWAMPNVLNFLQPCGRDIMEETVGCPEEVNIEQRRERLNVLFRVALGKGKINMARVLFRSGLVDVNLESKDDMFAESVEEGKTTLLSEEFRNEIKRMDIIEFLVESGAEITPLCLLYLATQMRKYNSVGYMELNLRELFAILRLFIRWGADLNAPVFKGRSFFDYVFDDYPHHRKSTAFVHPTVKRMVVFRKMVNLGIKIDTHRMLRETQDLISELIQGKHRVVSEDARIENEYLQRHRREQEAPLSPCTKRLRDAIAELS